MLSNDIVNFEQLGPECFPLSEVFLAVLMPELVKMYNSGSSAVDRGKSLGLHLLLWK